MGFVGVGAAMLVLAFLIYARMISARMKHRERHNRSERLILEQAETLDGFGKTEDAIRLLEQALQERPESNVIRSRLDILRARAEE